MFKYEKDMIPVLEREFEKKYSNANIIKEFNSGNGIADLTVVIESDTKPDILIQNYSEMFYLTNYFNRKGKRVDTNRLIEDKKLDSKTLYVLLEKLIESGYVVTNGNNYIVIELYKPAVKKVISIEAKLNKWKDGFHQALRYQCFSHKSYLALSSDKIKNVNINLLSEHKIGLISVFNDKIEFISNPQMQKPENITAYYHLTENVMTLRK